MTHRHAAFIAFFACCLSLVLASCRTREQAFSSSLRTDTLRVITLRVDTLRERDSIFIKEFQRGDTLLVEKHHYHTRYKVRLVRDTIYKAKTDTLRIEQTSRTQGASPASSLKPALQGAFVAFVCCGIVYVYLKFRK